MDQLYDGTPMLARRGLASAIDGLLKPKTGRWFSLRPRDPELAEDEAVARWLAVAEERLWRALYERDARFIQRSGEVDDDLVTFGTGVLFVGEGARGGSLSFRSVHLSDAWLAENADGVIDTIYVRRKLTAAQAAGVWGEAALGRETREAMRRAGADTDRVFEFVQAVTPRDVRDPGRLDNQHLPLSSLTIDVASRHVVAESGFHEFPFAVPRWDTASGELYGRSPGMLALSDARTLQAIGKTLLVAGQKAVDPPLWASDDAVVDTVRTFPGGITYVDPEAVRSTGGRPLGVINTGANLPLGREMQKDVREQVFAAFFRNVMQLPIAAPSMTATEVLERKEEFLRTIGPVFGRLESDYIAAVAERAFMILLRAGALPEPPQLIQGRDVEFEFASPVEKARKQIEAAGTARAIEMLAPFVQADPTVMDNFDGDAIARDVPTVFGVPQKWLRSAEAVAEKRGGGAGGMGMQGMPAADAVGGDMLAGLAGALPPEVAGALSGLVQPAGGNAPALPQGMPGIPGVPGAGGG